LTEIESMLTQVWSPGTRPLADEAWRCYNAGAMRASIAATWTAVTADLMAKVGHLADDGEPRARDVREQLDRTQQQGLTADGVRTMQGIEASLLGTALELEIIDAIDQRALERIREDRNLCVHPSLRPYNETYTPSPEVARAHLWVALDTVLIHRPTQGRKIIDLFRNFTSSQSFVPTINHIQSTYFDRVRTATRRNITIIAAKHAVLELDPDGRLDAQVYADRCAVVLSAFALRDRGLVRDAIVSLRDQFRQRGPNLQRRVLGRLGDQDYFWDLTDIPLIDHLNGLIGEPIATIRTEPSLGPTVSSVLSLVAVESARQRLPALMDQFAGLPPHHQASVIEARPDRYFVPAVIELIRDARGYRFGERLGQLLVSIAPSLTLVELDQALQSWSSNDQCWNAGSMPGAAVDLCEATAHLGPTRVTAFRAFLERVRAQTDEDEDFYTYPGLEAAVDRVESLR
jgi:hypothetical protein